MAIIIPSYWSSTVTFLGLDENYKGKKTLHLFRVHAASFRVEGGGKEERVDEIFFGGGCMLGNFI